MPTEPFKVLKTRFELGVRNDLVRLYHPAIPLSRSTIAWVAPNEAPAIVAWMAERTEPNVKWLEAREEVVAYLRHMAAMEHLCDDPKYLSTEPVLSRRACVRCRAVAALSAACPAPVEPAESEADDAD